MNDKAYIHLNELIFKSLEGEIAAEEFTQLDRILATDREAARYYNRIVAIYVTLDNQGVEIQSTKDSLREVGHKEYQAEFYAELMKLLQEENSAPSIERVRELDEVIESPTAPQASHISKRFYIYSALFSALAALLLVFLSIYGYIRNHRIVAILDSHVHAKWSQPLEVNELRPGIQFLQEGLARIHFNRGAEVLMQAPCEFELLTPNRMELISGRVSAYVPPEAKGFCVDTLEGAVIDYGTEFGVGIGKQLDVHVFQGQVLLNAHASGKRPASQQSLGGGQTARLEKGQLPVLGTVKDQAALFVRELPDPNRCFGLPGVRIDLADIVGGGNGYGTGLLGGYSHSAAGSVNPLNGHLNDTFRPPDTVTFAYKNGAGVQGLNTYLPVPAVTYVDGVFVPDGGVGPCIVSSKGHLFKQCPDTNGHMHWNVINGWRYRLETDDLLDPYLVTRCGISMHANLGITFDLARLRDDLNDLDITSFSSTAFIPASRREQEKTPQVDVWVLIDGQIQFERLALHPAQEVTIQIPIHPHHRFLSLIVTDGGNHSGTTLLDSSWTVNDWFFFADPVLQLGH